MNPCPIDSAQDTPPRHLARLAVAAALASALAACGGGNSASEAGAGASSGDGATSDTARRLGVSATGGSGSEGGDTWTRVAGEWESFGLSGLQTVRYGVGSNWTVRTMSGPGSCTNDFFGGDPAYGVEKHCEVAASAPVLAPNWTTVAREWDTFNVGSSQTVRFGAGASWIERSAAGEVPCTAAFFGNDPAYGVFKQCEIFGSGTPVETPPAGPPAPTWQMAYHVDAEAGDDSRDGLRPETAWKTLAKVRSTYGVFKPGVALLLKAGQTFPGSLRVEGVGSAGAPVVVASYGSGAAPVLSGFTRLGGWTARENGVWESSRCEPCGSRVNAIAVDGVLKPIGRFPSLSAANGGYLTVASHSGNSSITDSTFSHTENWVGGELVTRSTQYLLNRSTITGQSGSTFTSVGGGGVRDGFGYFIQNHPRTLVQPDTPLGAWYYNPVTKTVRMYFGSANPDSHNVKASSTDVVVNFSNLSHITVHNIAVEGANTSAYNLSNTGSIRLQNSSVRLSGVDGISGTDLEDVAIENVSVSDTNNNGVALAFPKRGLVKNNRVRNSGMVAGSAGSGDGGATGLAFSVAQGTVITGNEVVGTGFSGIFFTGHDVTVERNFVSHTCTVKDDCGGISVYQSEDDASISDSRILDNIVMDGPGAPQGTQDPLLTPVHGIYMDGRINTLLISGNTVARFAQSGIFVNHASNITLTGNTLFDNGAQIIMSSYVKPAEQLRGAKVTGNVLVSKANTLKSTSIFVQKPVQPSLLVFSETENEVSSFGQLDNNHYVNPMGSAVVDAYLTVGGSIVNRAFSLAGWQAAYGKDGASLGSPVVYPPGTDLSARMRFEYNASATPRQVALDATYTDAKGATQSGTLTLQPYTSTVLMK